MLATRIFSYVTLGGLALSCVACNPAGPGDDGGGGTGGTGGALTDGVVVLNEVFYNPIGAQWVEVLNADDEAVDISGWDLCGANLRYFMFPEDTVIDVGQILTVAWDHEDLAFDFSPDLRRMGFALGNKEKSVSIFRGAVPEGGIHEAPFIRDYLQWMEIGQARDDEAVEAEIWPADAFVPDTGPGASICFNGGTTNTAADYTIDPTPTPGLVNDACN